LLVRGEQAVGPLDRGSEGLLTRIGVAGALEQVEPGAQALQQLGGGEDAGAGGGELERERESFQARGDLRDLRVRLELGALAEERDSLVFGERWQCVGALSLNAQDLSRGDKQGEVRAGGEKLGKLGGALEEVLEVVEEKQELRPLQVGRERSERASTWLLSDRKCLSDRGQDE
jgi:hypothetical protein